MRSLYRGILVALTLSIVLLSASAAVAAPASWQSVDITLHDEQPSPVMLVSGTLAPSAKLPADVQIAVPSGGQLQWAGEILGGPADQDPEVKYAVASKDGMDVYSFTLKQARTAQVEVVMSGAIQSDATGRAAAIKWIADQDVPVVNISARIPQGSQIAVPAEGAQTVPGPTGFSYYQKTVKNVSAGDAVSLSFGYAPPAVQPGAATGATGGVGDNTALVIVIAVFAVAILFVGTAISRKMKRSEAEYDEDYDDMAAPAESMAAPVESYAFEDEEDAEAESSPAPRKQSQKKKRPEPQPIAHEPVTRRLDPRWLLAGIVVAALVVAGLLAGKTGTSAQLVDGAYMRNFGAASICTKAEIPLSIPGDANPAKAADKIFASLEGQPGIGPVSIYPDRPRAVVEFCSTTTSEQAIRSAISASGYLDPSAPVAPSQATTPSANGEG